MKPTFFATRDAFRAWFEKNHTTAKELVVGFYKRGTGKPSITWPESVDQALCFGWIDGIRRRVDAESYSIRFTPRRAGSLWSTVNIKRVAELTSQGLMQPAGLEAFGKRDEEKSRRYSYEQIQSAKLPPKYLSKIRANKKAWTSYEALAPSYRRRIDYWITTAKTEETRIRRLEKMIGELAAGRRL